MNPFALNVILAVVWAALTDSFTLGGIFLGLFVGFLALWISQSALGASTGYFRRIVRVVRLVFMFLYELLLSSFQVAWDVLTPTHLSRPAIIEMPLDVKSDAEILLVTNLISLTPGTLSLDVSKDRETLLIHAMFADDPDALIASLKNGMERWVREAFEP